MYLETQEAILNIILEIIDNPKRIEFIKNNYQLPCVGDSVIENLNHLTEVLAESKVIKQDDLGELTKQAREELEHTKNRKALNMPITTESLLILEKLIDRLEELHCNE